MTDGTPDASECEFWKGKGSCPDPAVATVTMPPHAPKFKRRCCGDHAHRFEEIGEEVIWDAELGLKAAVDTSMKERSRGR